MAALNIQIDIPNMGVYELEELKHKVTLYAKKLVAVSRKSETKDITKQYNHESFAGIFADNLKDDDLRDEYIQEKYGL
ncbi:MAG: hypothetical protein IJZ38_02610 [Bacteroides sp.]|nr:hypothetical protein [Bacteroides sp.]